MPQDTPHIAVVIPCYKVKAHIKAVIAAIPPHIQSIICVDDACPEESGAYIKRYIKDKRVTVLTHASNKGVGGAMITGYKHAADNGADIIVKIDGDGQMDPALISHFTAPIIAGQADYTKGNRFYRVEDVKTMPAIRLIGNAVLSFMTKLSSGYWTIFDPTNGYTAIRAAMIKDLPLDKLSPRYFFESDMLFRLNTLRAVVQDIPMRATYADEESNLNIKKIIVPFLWGHSKNLLKRLFYNYILRDFSIASIELVLGPALLIWGIAFGLGEWAESEATGQIASAGTVMISALPIIIGSQLTLSFLHYDIQSIPRYSSYKSLHNEAGSSIK